MSGLCLPLAFHGDLGLLSDTAVQVWTGRRLCVPLCSQQLGVEALVGKALGKRCALAEEASGCAFIY